MRGPSPSSPLTIFQITIILTLLTMNTLKLTILTHDDNETLQLLKSIITKKHTRLMTEVLVNVNGKSVCLACFDHYGAPETFDQGACHRCDSFLGMNPDPWI
jgi:hypothetical protein